VTGGRGRELGQGTRTGNIDRGQIRVVKQNSKNYSAKLNI